MSMQNRLTSPRNFVAAFGIVTLVAVVVAASTSATAFGIYNAAWNGASDLQSIADTTGTTNDVVRSTTAYTEASPNNTVAVVLSPDRAYTPRERERIDTFVRSGGTLVVAEDYGVHSNGLLAALGAQSRFDGHPLRDERYNYQSPAMPVARNVTDHPAVNGIGSLTLNHGTAVVPNNATVLVRSSGYAYLDTNANTDVDNAETVTEYPVATIEQVGQGEVVAVGDPSLFINTMLDRSGNRRFVQNLFGSHSHVLLDYSHTANVPPLAIALLIVRDSPLLQFLGGTLCALAIVVIAQTDVVAALRTTVPGLGSKTVSVEADDAELATYLRERHPEWDGERIQRVVAARRGAEQERE